MLAHVVSDAVFAQRCVARVAWQNFIVTQKRFTRGACGALARTSLVHTRGAAHVATRVAGHEAGSAIEAQTRRAPCAWRTAKTRHARQRHGLHAYKLLCSDCALKSE